MEPKKFLIFSLLILSKTLLADDPSIEVGDPDIPLLVDNMEGAFTRMLLSFFAFILLGGASFYFLRRFIRQKNYRGQSRKIIIKEKKMLSPKTVVFLIEVEGKKLVVSESQLEVRLLDSENKSSPFPLTGEKKKKKELAEVS